MGGTLAGGYPGGGGTLVGGTLAGGYPGRGVPWQGYPGQVPPNRVRMGGGTQLGQHREYLLHGGRYASCVHAGGLSCFVLVLILGNYAVKKRKKVEVEIPHKDSIFK